MKDWYYILFILFFKVPTPHTPHLKNIVYKIEELFFTKKIKIKSINVYGLNLRGEVWGVGLYVETLYNR